MLGAPFCLLCLRMRIGSLACIFVFVDFMTEKRVNEIYVGHKVVNDYYVANSH